MSKIKDVSYHEGEPPDNRESRLSAAMLKAFDEHMESGGAKAIAFVTIDHGKRHTASTALSGYEGDEASIDAAMDLFAHLQAMFAARGIRVELMPVRKPGEG